MVTSLQPGVVQKKYPLRYWMLVAYAVGIPNFVKFDETGRTHKAGLFNLTSVATIVLVLTISAVLLVITALSRSRLIARRLDACGWVWFALLCNLAVSTILGPPNRLAPDSHTDLFASLFRLFSWAVGFLLLASVYSREPRESALDLTVRLIGTATWINIFLIWFFLPIYPSQVFAVPGDATASDPRLGGLMIHPLGLAMYAAVGFFYALFFWRGWKRWGACALALVTLVLTYARSGEVSFLIVLLLYLFVLSRRTGHRWSGMLLLLAGAGAAVFLQDRISVYFARGHGLENVVTLSERTYVWQAALRAFKERPFLGYGFMNGVKNALRDQWTFQHWIPPECHNELLQALVSGGISAGVLVLYLQLQTVWKALGSFRRSRQQLFLLLVLTILMIMSLTESILTNGFSRSTAIFLFAFFGLTDGYRRTSTSTMRAQIPAESETGKQALTGAIPSSGSFQPVFD